MARVKLTVAAKVFITAVILGVVALTFYLNPDLVGRIAPSAAHPSANVPPPVALPDEVAGGGQAQPAGNDAAIAKAAALPAGCANLPEVRFYHWAWNAQMGLMAATGGKQAVANSVMCKHGVNLKLIREDNTDNMQALLVTLAEGLKGGQAQPSKGAHFVAIMGDGSATFLKGLNDKLAKIGPDYVAQVVGSAGYSRGEDKFMGPPAWKQNPQAARGGLVAGVLRDGDWNIALKWLGDNKIPNNPDETTYDPDALNWVNASDYIDAAQKYVSGFCTELTNVKTKKKEKRCVDGVVTWTPGDVTVAEKKGGLASIVSTREYRSQMPNVIIGSKRWMSQNRKLVTGMLSAIFEANDAIKASDDKLKEAAAVSALVYGEQDAAYWYKYFKVQTQKDKQGVTVELGGSAVNNLADNLQLFGLVPGSANLFAATYTVFGNLVKSQYPALLPSFYPIEQVLDTSYVKELAEAGGKASVADVAVFKPEEKVERVVSRRAWNIEFVSGKANFTPAAAAQMETLFSELVVASGTLVEVHGHTDDQGNADANQKLSEARAFAVKEWLEKRSPTNFSEGRVRIFAHGQTQPVAPNSTPEGKAKNRRVEIVLGTST
ncbi:MAG: OmpA family protein [Polyangiaceae bacterium]|nr:OmpA family protein [Polyangiaceae bacterium]